MTATGDHAGPTAAAPPATADNVAVVFEAVDLARLPSAVASDSPTSDSPTSDSPPKSFPPLTRRRPPTPPPPPAPSSLTGTHHSPPPALPLPPPLVPSFARVSSDSHSSFTTSPTSSASLRSGSLSSRNGGDDDAHDADDENAHDAHPYSDNDSDISASRSLSSRSHSFQSTASTRSRSSLSSSTPASPSSPSEAPSPASLHPDNPLQHPTLLVDTPPTPTPSTPPSLTPRPSTLSTTPPPHPSPPLPGITVLPPAATGKHPASAPGATGHTAAQLPAASHVPPPPWTVSVYNLSCDTVHIEHPNRLGTTSNTGLPLETRRFRRFRAVRVTRVMHDIAMGRTRGAHAFLFRRAVGPHFLALCRHTHCFLRDAATAAALRASAPAPPAAAVLRAPSTPAAPVAARSLLRAAADGLRRAERQLPLSVLSDVHLGFTRVFTLDDPALHSLPLVRDVIPPAPLALPLASAPHDARAPVLSLAVSYRPVASAAASVLAIPAAAWPPVVAVVRALCRRLGLSAFRLWTDRVLAARKPPAPLRGAAARVLPFLLFPTLVIAPSAAHDDATRMWGAVEQLAAGLGHGIIHPGPALPAERVPRLWVGPHVAVTSDDPTIVQAQGHPKHQQPEQQEPQEYDQSSQRHSYLGPSDGPEYSSSELKLLTPRPDRASRTDRRPRAPIPDSPPRMARRGSIDLNCRRASIAGGEAGSRRRMEVGSSGALSLNCGGTGVSDTDYAVDDDGSFGQLGSGSFRRSTASGTNSWHANSGTSAAAASAEASATGCNPLKRGSSRVTDGSKRATDGCFRRIETHAREPEWNVAAKVGSDMAAGLRGSGVESGGGGCGGGGAGATTTNGAMCGLTWVGGLQHDVEAGMRHVVAAMMCGLLRDKTVRWANEAQELLEWASVVSSTVVCRDMGHVLTCDDCSRPIGYTSHDRVMTLLSSATAITPGSPDAFAIARAYPMVDVPAARMRMDGRTWDGFREWVAESCMWGSESDERGETRRSVLDNTKAIVVSDGSANALAILQFAIADSTPDRLLVAYLLVGLCTETRNRSGGVAEWCKRFWPAAPMQLWGHFETVHQDTSNRDALSAMALLVGAASGLDYTDIACASEVTTVNVRKVKW